MKRQQEPGCLLRVKQPRPEVDPSPSPIAEAKSERSKTPLLPICLHGMGRYNFAVAFTFT
jgi:hypothetical protein